MEVTYNNNSPPPHKDDELKEEFCGACALVPIAFAGAGTSAYGSQKRKTIIMWSGLVLTILSIALFVYLKKYKKCTACIKP